MKKVLLTLMSFIMTSAVLADEKSFYDFSWLDKDKEIYVLQNRKFRKDGNFYVGATAAYNLSQDFLDAYGGTLRAGYFFQEEWGFEFLFGKFISSESDSAKGVKSQGAFPFYREIDTVIGAMVQWAPFYSKINTFNKIFYYDWIFGLGIAGITTNDNRNLFNTSLSQSEQRELTNENNVGAIWNTGLRFYINQNWSMRLDITGVTYKAERTKSDESLNRSTESQFFTNYDLGLGFNYVY